MPCKVNNPIMIKEINFLEGYPIFTAKIAAIKGKETLWGDLSAGQIIRGKISKILSIRVKGQTVSKIDVKISEYVHGTIDHLNFSDVPRKKLPKYLTQQSKKVRLRVLSVSPEKKVLKLTVKP